MRTAHQGREDGLVTSFDEETLRTIDRLAERDGRSRAEVLQAAVREYIAKNALPGEDSPVPPPKGG
jgi:metal-responsive CopG/Arc/MetJ family transcriptional regulator